MAQAVHNHDLLLFGSLPLETAEEVLESCGPSGGRKIWNAKRRGSARR
jgi:hypothetical protein